MGTQPDEWMMLRQTLILVIFVTLLLGVPDTVCSAQSLKVLTRDTSAIGGPALRHGKSFGERTGTTVSVDQISLERLYDRTMLGFVTGELDYDVLLIPSDWLADFAPYLAPVPKAVLDRVRVNDIYPVYRNALMRWGNRWMALTIGGDLHMGTYRRDLFEDEAARDAFQQRYGHPLQAPCTWSEYTDIAAFFSGRRSTDGRPMAGALEAYARNGQRIWYLFSHAAAYASHPAHPGAMFFDPVSMQPSIDNPAWVRAPKEYMGLRRSGPADVERLDSVAVHTRFAAGTAAMDIDWADTGVLAGGLAHDLNNILAVILGNLTQLESGLKRDSVQHEHWQRAMAATDRAARQVERLLTFARRQGSHPRPWM
jgi:multiple sugar transport system substrate-binding protein